MSSAPEPVPLASGKLRLDEPASGVARIRISNPEKRGALDHEMLDALSVTVAELDARCLVITGEGPVFSAGYDIGDLSGESLVEAAEKLVAHPFHAAIEALERYPYPTVAVLNGHAIGGGLELAVTCDIRIAARGIKLGMPPAKLGLIYSHTGIRKFLEVCGVAHTNEIFLVGRNLDAQRAERIGLVNRCVDAPELDEASLSLASEIAANAPLALRGNKRVIAALRASSELSEEVARELVDLRESCFRTEDFREGVRAFAEKRPPRWSGR